MNPLPTIALPPPLAAAVQRVKQAVRDAAERTVESLGLSAMAAANAMQRDSMLGAQFELKHKFDQFLRCFNAAFDDQVAGECGLRGSSGQTSWDALTLVDDHELEIKVQAERFGLEITHVCEWELRELEAYVGSVLGHGRAERERNPLRPEIIGQGVIRAIEDVSERPEVRKVLDAEFSRSLASVLRGTFGEIVRDLRQAGIQPVSLTVRTTEDRSESSRAGGLDGGPESSRSAHGPLHDSRHSMPGTLDGRRDSALGNAWRSSRPGPRFGQVDPGMMTLLRRLAFADPVGAQMPAVGWGREDGAAAGGELPALPNLIHVHRDELRQASRGAIDHMVIDVIGSLFDQILSDPKVPPQMARQIARLQLPVLRAALGDPSFFSSRRHPVRRFINRLASLGVGFDDFSNAHGRAFLAKVSALVQEIVEGDFEQVETYDGKLAALETFVVEQARSEVAAQGNDAEALLNRKEDELRLRQHYAQQLERDLRGLTAPTFVHDFVSRVWSQVLLRVAERDGAGSERVQRVRLLGRELFMSVQPKTSPAQRKAFLAELPKLMQGLNEGLSLIGWTDADKKAFFGQLLPAHSEALRAQLTRTLDYNMMARQVEQAFERKLPSRADLPAGVAPAALEPEIVAASLSRDEAQRVGFVDESAVDWDGKVDIDLNAEPEVSAVDLELPGLPTPTDAAEPMHGKSLADHVQIGFSYQMHLEGDWQKVRLAHVSPGRSFFVFTRGTRHQRTISLTYRMLVRLCESGRMRAFEGAYLLDRATARARRQLSALQPAPGVRR